MYDILYKDSTTSEPVVVATNIAPDEISQVITDLYLSDVTAEIGSGYYAQKAKCA